MLLRTVTVLIALTFGVTAYAQVAPVSRPSVITPAQTITAGNGLVVAQEQRAARIGIEILDRGGNAVDAAVAVGFALAVTYPRAGNIGGGGFMVIHLAKTGEDAAIDYRETAPAAATEKMFLDEKGEADPKKSRDSALSIGVPGTVAGLALAHEKYGSGKLTLAELIEPAITLARNGVEIVDDIADTLPLAQPRIARWQSSAPVFLNSDGTVLMPGQDLLQPDLAITLRAIASDGPKGFYEGPVAEKIVAAVRKAGGIMTTEDMKNYRAILREPIRGTYRGYDIISMPPPSSGGVHLIEMLNILEGYDLAKLSREESLHIIAEAMKRAYADRATFMGDPDAVKMPVAGLISKKYAAALRAQIGQRATPASDIHSGNPADFEGQNTTHFSVIDRDGNAVSNTYTLNFSYGLGLVAEGTGVLLNNELDDFTSKPGTANAYGLVGYNANLPGPNRRPLSSMTPTIFLKDGKPFLITGSPGGSRIISTVLQIIVNVIDFNLAVDQAVSAPRIHHQWQPDELFVEPGISPEILEGLVKRGYKVTPNPPQTSANSIEITSDGYVGAADRRTRGSLAAGY
ncbi:MAG TPA: gamma-glutamyltransferase [Xanthobacteraceae bacterium]|jgi:gamma-glutamyltranspeptidase / glutathione hydrolase|nr:gamma-glutamyltransferase [Xanthobacteraceae bacterium]